MDYKNITMDDIRYLIEESQAGYNRYNVETIRPDTKKWTEGYIVNEEQSVKWNREQVELHNKEVDKALKKYHSKLREGYKNFRTDLKQAMQNDYNFTATQAGIIMTYLYDDGMYEDLCRAETLCDVVSEVLQIKD